MTSLPNSLRGQDRLAHDKIKPERLRPDSRHLGTLKTLKLFSRDNIEILERPDRNKPPVIVVTRRAVRRMAPAGAR